MTFVLYSIFSREDQLLAYVTSSLPFRCEIFLKAHVDRFQSSLIQMQLLLVVRRCCGGENRNCCGCVKVHLVSFLMQHCSAFLALCVVVSVDIYTYIRLYQQWSFTISWMALLPPSPLPQSLPR